jgi:hypothetical protein
VKTIFLTGVTTLIFASSVLSAELIDNEAVVLPLEAQTCNLPVAPARIPQDADYEGLKKAKGNVSAFQEKMVDYRECLDAAMIDSSLTDGNKLALTNAHNYSVEMEERIAEQFNVAVRAYKAREADK